MNTAPVPSRASRAPRAPRLPHGRPLTYAPPGYQARLRATLHRVAGHSGRGWQAVVAVELGVSANAVYVWVTGGRMPSLTLLVRISEASGINLHWLVVGTGPIAAPEPVVAAARNTGAVP